MKTALGLGSTTVKVYQHASGTKKGDTTKKRDATGVAWRRKSMRQWMYLGIRCVFLLSSRNRNDICMAQTLLAPFNLRGKLILTDKGYDSGKFVRWLEERGGIAVIPSRVKAKHPRHTGWHT